MDSLTQQLSERILLSRHHTKVQINFTKSQEGEAIFSIQSYINQRNIHSLNL